MTRPRTDRVPGEFVTDAAPLVESERVPDCPLCGSERQTRLASGYDYELRTCRNEWTFVRCASESCGHVWLNPRPAVSTLSVIYPPHYYAYHYEETVPSMALRIKNALDRRKFASITRALGRQLSSFVDVGCGDGRYLRFARMNGVKNDRNFGLELDQRTVDRLQAQGFVGLNRRVEDCREIADGTIDIATMFHVIEHVEDPAMVVRRMAGWLSPGGVLAVETPNIESLDARLFGRTFWGGYHIPRHWNMFSRRTLCQLMERAGLEIVGVYFQTGHSFWLYSVHHWLRYGPTQRLGGRMLSRMFDPFGGVPALPALAAFTAFDKVRAGCGMQTSSMMVIGRKRTG